MKQDYEQLANALVEVDSRPLRKRSAWLVVWAALFLFCAFPAWAAEATEAERAWIEGAEALVAAAKNHAEASAFQREVQAHRERLSGIVLGAESASARRPLHATLVLLGALLKSAADCQRTGHIVCEASLIRRLEAQLKLARAQLAAVEA